ncbi:MAG TPA: hypothetical protein GX502_06555 [Syntrophaceticus sp.]|nr:hypothetical protein [Syntrophaceticus sp.]
MVTREMIEEIISRVLEKLNNQRILLMVLTTEGVKRLDPLLFAKTLQGLQSLYQLRAIVSGKVDDKIRNILMDFGAEVIEDTNCESLERVVSRAEAVILPAADQDTLARIALGLLDRTVSKVVFETLYEGKKVIICPDGLLSKPCIPQGLRCFIEEYLKKARGIGCIISPLEEVKIALGSICESVDSKSDAEKCEEEIYCKKLLTAEDVNRIPRNVKSLVLGNGVLVTPLARDQLRTRGIEVVLRKGEKRG